MKATCRNIFLNPYSFWIFIHIHVIYKGCFKIIRAILLENEGRFIIFTENISNNFPHKKPS